MSSIDTIAFDWDGVVHEHAAFTAPMGNCDLELLREAIARGYSVAVMTCNNVGYVSGYLRDHGFRVYADTAMRYMDWESAGDLVLVTNRKVCAGLYADDKGFEYHYGQGGAGIFAEAERRKAARLARKAASGRSAVS